MHRSPPGALTAAAIGFWAAACGQPTARPAAPTTAAPPADGDILERAPCPVITDVATFRAAVDAYHVADIVKAGLADQLAAHPLDTIFTVEENQRLIDATAAGRCERIVYRSDGLRVVGYVVRPAAPGPHPVLIWLRGGNREFGKIMPVTLLNLAWLAEAGFVVIATQYRGVDGGEGTDQFGGDDVDDVLALLPLARALPDADAARLFLFGGSRGAMQGLLAMRRGLPVRAAAFRGGLYDLPRVLAYRPELATDWSELIPDWSRDRDSAMARRSAINWVGEIKVPMLLLHGRQDWRVQLADTRAFSGALALADIENLTSIYDHDEHQLALHRAEYLGDVADWFRAHGAFGPP